METREATRTDMTRARTCRGIGLACSLRATRVTAASRASAGCRVVLGGPDPQPRVARAVPEERRRAISPASIAHLGDHRGAVTLDLADRRKSVAEAVVACRLRQGDKGCPASARWSIRRPALPTSLTLLNRPLASQACASAPAPGWDWLMIPPPQSFPSPSPATARSYGEAGQRDPERD